MLALVLCGSASAANRPVMNNADMGSGSLRDTIATANPGDTVVIPASVGPITLTSGQIVIDKNLTIRGAGASTTSVSGNNASRIFCIQAPACPAAASGTQPSVSISGMTITAGKVTTGVSSGGAGIFIQGSLSSGGADGTLNLDRMTFTNDNVTTTSSSSGGGAVFSLAGRLNISNSTFTNNSSTSSGGPNCCTGGGAIFDEGGPIKVVNTTIGPNNTATVPNSGCCAGGGGVYDEGGKITLDKSHVDGNTATVTNSCCNGGGGVYSIGGTIALANSTVNENKTTVTDTSNSGNGAGGLFNFGSIIVANSHVDGNSTTVNDTGGVIDGGGGMLVYGGLTVSRSSISSNSANLTETNNSVINGGGGVYTLSPAAFFDSTLANNSLTISAGMNTIESGGGALYNLGGTWTLSGTTIGPNNSASLTLGGGASQVQNGGGAVYDLSSGPNTGPRLSRSTIAQNSLTMIGAGPSDGGGGIISNGGKGRLAGVTIANNSASGAPGGGIFAAQGTGSSGPYTFQDTIIANNSAASGQNCAAASGVTGAFASGGFNIESTNQCGLGAAGDHVNTNPQLRLLANNGGPTQTMAIPTSSPAFDKGSSFGLLSDQRGAKRPFNFPTILNAAAPGADGSDIGAFEIQPRNVFSFGQLKRNKHKGTAVLTVNVPGPDSGVVVLSGDKVKTKTKHAGGAGPLKISIVPNATAEAKLLTDHKLKLTVHVTYTPDGGGVPRT
ncbi:MAG: hypothetical protein E6G00_09615, partial [Actinobacteria bacterium]